VRRSPLNIVHAGLDIMQAEIDAQGGAAAQTQAQAQAQAQTQVVISPETAKMVRNMFAASETAIHILNDLLHYEHIDAGATRPTETALPYDLICFDGGIGTFQLELAVHPLMNFLGKNIDWAKMLAADKHITILTEDSTVPNTQHISSGPTPGEGTS